MESIDKRGGFSLIEVLIASTILLMLVMMLGMLFQSTSQAWRTGSSRADRYTLVRGFFGAFQRDVSTAVDESQIPAEVKTKLGGTQRFSSSSAQFYTLSGNGFQNDNPNNIARCSPSFVSYSGTSRSEKRLLANGSTEQSEYSVVGESSKVGNVDNITFYPYYDRGGSTLVTGGSGFPAYMVIVATFSSGSSGGSANLNVGVEARSAGPDGIWNTSDDLSTATKD